MNIYSIFWKRHFSLKELFKKNLILSMHTDTDQRIDRIYLSDKRNIVLHDTKNRRRYGWSSNPWFSIFCARIIRTPVRYNHIEIMSYDRWDSDRQIDGSRIQRWWWCHRLRILLIADEMIWIKSILRNALVNISPHDDDPSIFWNMAMNMLQMTFVFRWVRV